MVCQLETKLFYFWCPLQSNFAYYPCLILCGSEADKMHVWRIVITWFLVFALVSFISASRNCVFMSKTADPSIFADGWGLLVPMLDQLSR